MTTEAFDELSREVGRRLRAAGLLLSTAESCTGGWVSKVLTDVAGSSGWFDRGFVTYSNEAKLDMLGVPSETLTRHGAVSEPAVREMAEGALRNSRSQVAVAISGIAGPEGGSAEKPVGTVWLAWAVRGRETRSERVVLAGDRSAVRGQAVELALRGILDVVTA